MSDSNRLTILSNNEIDQLFSIPYFTPQEQESYFTLEPDERDIMLTLGSTQSRVIFILQLGYFKAKQAFFPIDIHRFRQDISYISRMYDLDLTRSQTGFGQKAKLNHQTHILNLYGYKKFTRQCKRTLLNISVNFTKITVDPKNIFEELTTFLKDTFKKKKSLHKLAQDLFP